MGHPMDDLHFQGAAAIAQAIRDRRISAAEALEHFLARVAKYNGDLNAVVWLDADNARRRAREADAALARGEAAGPLHGVPMTVKESFNVAGAPTTWGDPGLTDNVPATSALAVERLTSAGAVVFGKTNVPLMLADHQSYNAVYGATVNPWDAARVPGGSSGGSAAALAAGLTGLEAGSDIGGSIRVPAHFCGVFGLKPTFAIAAPAGQALPGAFAYADMSVIGPLARSAVDLDVALAVMAGPDAIDGTAFKVDLPACGTASLAGLRVAVKLSDRNFETDSAYADRIAALADTLGRYGATVRETAPDVDTARLHEIYITLLRAATSGRTPAADIARWREAAALEPGRYPYLDLTVAGSTLSHRDWLGLNNERHRLRRVFTAFFEDWDILLCPAALAAAPPHDRSPDRWRRTITVNGRQVAATDNLFWQGWGSLLYLPAAVGPLGLLEGGLPAGYQALAAAGRDRTAIAFARLVERDVGGFVPPPGFP